MGTSYNILAKLTVSKYNEVKSIFPAFEISMQRHISSYSDPNKQFFYKAL